MANFADPNVDTNSQRVVLAAGSAAAPSLTWANDLTQGFYFDATTNQIVAVGFSGGGTTFPLLAPDGSSVAPSYGFSNESNPQSGLFMDGIDLHLQSNQSLLLTGTASAHMGVDNDNFVEVDPDGFIYLQSDGITRLQINGNSGAIQIAATSDLQAAAKVTFDASAVAGETRMLLWDVDTDSLQRVTVGVADSGGVGFKVLRIPN